MLFITGVLILIDQISKYCIRAYLYKKSIEIIPHVLNFTYVENRGALFGIGQNSTLFFIIFSFILIVLLVLFTIKQKKNLRRMEKIFLSIIIAGGIGNLLDRIIFGFVTDFLDIRPLFSWPVFNMSDIYVVLGCVLLGINLFTKEKALKK